MQTLRVLVFGATGTGKTSLCNLLSGRSRPTDNGARGITAKPHVYPPIQVGDAKVELIDTAGLHESTHGTVPADKAVVALIELLESARDGFCLLIHVTRASRITKEHDDDYVFFVEKLTQGRIPVVLAITGCENEQPMSGWVVRNREAFARFGYRDLIPTCCATGGPMDEHFAPLRMESRDLVLGAIATNALREPVRIYGPGTGRSFDEALTRYWNELVTLIGLPEKYRRKVNESAFALLKRLGVPDKVADAAIKHIPDLLEEVANKTPVPGSGKVIKGIARYVLVKILRRNG